MTPSTPEFAIAFDVATLAEALALDERLGAGPELAKVGLELFAAAGPEVVARVTMQALGRKTTVRPGWLSKLLGWSLAMLPRWGQVMVMLERPDPPSPQTLLNGDCDDWASAMGQAMELLGLSGETKFVQRLSTDNPPLTHFFYMLPSHTGPWNYHAVCQVVDRGVNRSCYSVTQSNLPVGSWAQMVTCPHCEDHWLC